MNMRGYSLVEVVIAAAIAAIGVAAAAAIMNTLVIQEEQNAGSVRAANLQEQAAMLYRLGVTNASDIYGILPEVCSGSGAPAAGTFSLVFGSPAALTRNVTLSGGGTVPISFTATTCTLTYAGPVSGGGQASYLSNTVTIVRPTIKVGP